MGHPAFILKTAKSPNQGFTKAIKKTAPGISFMKAGDLKAADNIEMASKMVSGGISMKTAH